MLRLNCDLIVHKNNTVYLAGKKSYKIDKTPTPIIKLLHALNSGIDTQQLKILTKDPTTTHLLKILQSLDLTVMLPGHEQNDFTSRSDIFLSRVYGPLHHAKSKLRSMRATVLGCGGIGANIAYHLVASGVKNFTLVDPECVEPSNLNRQYPYTRHDVGKLKIHALANYILSIQPTAQITAIAHEISSLSDLNQRLPKSDLLICGIDRPAITIKQTVTLYAQQHDSDIIFCGAGYETVSIGPLLTTRTAKINYINDLSKRTQNMRLADLTTSPGSLGPINSCATSILAALIIQHYASHAPTIINNKEILLNPWSLSIERETIYD